jgi:hypothetical protein
LPDPTVYRVRANAFAGARAYRLTDDALVIEEEGKPLDGAFYDEIAEVQLAFVPNRFARNRYRARIVFRKGGMAEIFNTNYAGFADFSEQNAEYVEFLTELHRRLAVQGKDVRFVHGLSSSAYLGNVLLTVFIFAVLALVFVMFLTWGLVWIAAVKVAIILFFIPTLVRFLRSARPGEYDPTALPHDVLPAMPAAVR